MVERSVTLLWPAAAQEVVDEGGDIADIDTAILIAIGGVDIDVRSVAAQQVVNQGGHISNVHVAVSIHVALNK